MFWWRDILGVNEESSTSCIQNEKHLPLVSCRHESDVKSLTPPGCAEERSEDGFEEDNILIAQLMRLMRFIWIVNHHPASARRLKISCNVAYIKRS